ncbi:MAG: putative lipid II flippase FtsW [Myxococcota bacterium]
MNRDSQSRRTTRNRRALNGGKPPVRPQYLGGGRKIATLDGGVLTATAILISLGIVMSYSATAPLALDTNLPPLFLDHLIGLGIGLAAALIAMGLPLRVWQKLALPLWAVGVTLLAATLLFGIEVNGARRWLEIPGIGFRFQPVEVAKGATILAVALLSTPREGREQMSNRRTLGTLGLAMVPVLLLLAQPDLGNAVLLAALSGLIVFVAGAPWRLLGWGAVLGAGGVGLFIARNEYAWRRISGFIDPWQDAQNSGFQLVQSFVAFSHGGLFGAGLGNGWQKLHYLPEVHTDFVLSLVAEEMGLLGVLLVLGAFAALLVAGTRIARRANSRFALLLAFGITALLTVPSLINAGVVMGVLPTKGLTLPFLSYGGTSLVVCCGAVGLLLGIARREASAPPPVISGATSRGLAWD